MAPTRRILGHLFQIPLPRRRNILLSLPRVLKQLGGGLPNIVSNVGLLGLSRTTATINVRGVRACCKGQCQIIRVLWVRADTCSRQRCRAVVVVLCVVYEDREGRRTLRAFGLWEGCTAVGWELRGFRRREGSMFRLFFIRIYLCVLLLRRWQGRILLPIFHSPLRRF